MVSKNPCALAMIVGSLLFYGNNYSQEFPLMSGIVAGSTSQLFTIV